MRIKPRKLIAAGTSFSLTVAISTGAILFFFWCQTPGARILYWDVLEKDNCYILVGPEAIPYTVAQIRNESPRSGWYVMMLREILDPPRITELDPSYVAPLKQAIVDLKEIAETGTPAARKHAKEALRWMRGYGKELFDEHT